MSPHEIASLLRRHLAIVLVLVASAMFVVYYIEHSPHAYQDSGIVIFIPPRSAVNPNPFAVSSNSLIETAGVIALEATGVQGRRTILQAGGNADFDITPANLYNLEYPDYGDPYVTVEATSTNRARTQRTFVTVVQFLVDQLAKRQTKSGVVKRNRITAHLIGGSAPVIQNGSRVRVLAGLAALALVAIFSVVNFLDNVRLRRRAPVGQINSFGG